MSSSTGKEWVSSEFGSSIESYFKKPHALSSKKRLFPSVPKTDSSLSWCMMYSPKTKDELAIHKKKVGEVEQWLCESLKALQSKTTKHAPLLLLTGPSGSGKTATVQAIANDLNIEVQEWSNQMSMTTSVYNSYSTEDFFTRKDDFQEENQLTQFETFLFRANRYSSLFSNEKSSKVILIEDFPNIFIQDPQVFYLTFRRYRLKGHCPVIFIISDSANNLDFKLFPNDVLEELKVSKISFNPVSSTLINKGLKRIISEVDKTVTVPSQEELDALVSGCSGDIRSAVYSLEFLCTKSKGSSSKVVKRRTSGRKRKAQAGGKASLDETKASTLGNRDSALFLFHALGKILYCKRDESKFSEIDKLSPHLNHLEKPPPLEDPEEVFQRTNISEEKFILFLHHNCGHFYSDIESAASCSLWFSESDYLSSDWNSEKVMRSYSLSIASRGIMFDLRRDSNSRGWKPLEKPQWNAAVRNFKQQSILAKRTFKDWRYTGTDLQMDIIPFLSKLQSPTLSSVQKRIVKEVGEIQNNRSSFRQGNRILDEKDNNIDEEELDSTVYCCEEDSTTNDRSTVKDNDEEEEIVIEEIDD